MKKIKILLTVVTLFLFGCGTDTGNPTMTSPIPVSATSPASDQISYYLCEKIRNCFSPALVNCESKLKITSHISASLGLNEATYSNLNAIQAAIDSQFLTLQSSKMNLCLQAITNTSCSNSDVQQSYSSSDLENLTQAWKLLTIDSNCNQFIN